MIRMPNCLHGHTKIELFNAESGELENVVEDDNELTGALTELFQGLGKFGHGDSLVQYIDANMNSHGFNRKSFNLTQWFGGMLALDEEQDASSPHVKSTSEIIASGVYNESNIGSNQIRGSYNSTESVLDFDNKTMTLVYDFATNQGNGRINSICLTPWLGGFMNEGRARTRTSYYGLPVDECFQPNYYSRSGSYSGSTSSDYRPYGWLPLFGYLGQGLTNYSEDYSGQVNYGWYNPLNSDYMGKGSATKILEVDPTTNTILAAKIELSSGVIYLTFYRYPLAGTEIDVWYGNGFNTPVAEESLQIEVGNALYNHVGMIHFNYDYESRKVYVVSFPFDIRNYTSTNWSSSQRNGVSAGSDISVWAIDVDPVSTDSGDTYTVTSYTVPNNTNVSLVAMGSIIHNQARNLQFFCYDGYMYVYGPVYNSDYYNTAKAYTIYKIQLSNPANVVAIQTNITSFAPIYAVVMDAHDGRIYLNFGSNVVRVLNTDMNELYAYEELLHYDYENYAITPIRGFDALACENGHLIGVRPNVLMTVNNITAVTKTSAQTMKISYTISGS